MTKQLGIAGLLMFSKKKRDGCVTDLWKLRRFIFKRLDIHPQASMGCEKEKKNCVILKVYTLSPWHVFIHFVTIFHFRAEQFEK